MNIITDNIIAGKLYSEGKEHLKSYDPIQMKALEESFTIATIKELNIAVDEATKASKLYKHTSGNDKAIFLRAIATEIENLGDTLINRVMLESGLPEGRVRGERGRTCGQLRMFAQLVEDGDWIEATIDEALPERKPLPRVDLRKMLMSIGPVAIFGASNFPLAFSTAGGDTASALAAGCPVIVKSHPSHLGTNNLITSAINKAIEECGLPKGIFSSIQGGIEIGQSLTNHPQIKAVAFTGSLKAGLSLMKTASQRAEPIPVYAEMGSNNLVFILPEKIQNTPSELAKTIANSVNLGAGQFCTNPGIIVIQKDKNTDSFLNELKTAFSDLLPGTMLNQGIYNNYNSKKKACVNNNGVEVLFDHVAQDNWKGAPSIATVDAKSYISNKELQEEIFGPFTLVVCCENKEEMEFVASNIQGQLTSTILGTDDEIIKNNALVDLLIEKVGRLIFNGMPTGVEVSHAMHHGGPFPATSNGMFTSVGTGAIKRFTRPIVYQNALDQTLPEALKSNNPLGIWRTINGKITK